LLQISLNNYYFSFYGIGDAIKAWKGCGIAQRRLCRSLGIASRVFTMETKRFLIPVVAALGLFFLSSTMSGKSHVAQAHW
jgi:hypothetical protein